MSFESFSDRTSSTVSVQFVCRLVVALSGPEVFSVLQCSLFDLAIVVCVLRIFVIVSFPKTELSRMTDSKNTEQTVETLQRRLRELEEDIKILKQERCKNVRFFRRGPALDPSLGQQKGPLPLCQGQVLVCSAPLWRSVVSTFWTPTRRTPLPPSRPWIAMIPLLPVRASLSSSEYVKSSLSHL